MNTVIELILSIETIAENLIFICLFYSNFHDLYHSNMWKKFRDKFYPSKTYLESIGMELVFLNKYL